MWEIGSHLLTAALGSVATWLFKDLATVPYATGNGLRLRGLTMLAEYSNVPPRELGARFRDFDDGVLSGDKRSLRLVQAQEELRSLGIELSTFAQVHRRTAWFFLRVLKVDLRAGGTALIGFANNMDQPGVDRAHFRRSVLIALRASAAET